MTNEASNIKPLISSEAIAKCKELIEHESVCHFITRLDSTPFSTRPMGVRKVSDDGSFWFLSSSESNKNNELEIDNRVHLLFSNTSNYEFLSLFGTAAVSRNQQKIDELWTDYIKAWFPDGKTDAHIRVIEVKPTEGFYWDTKDGKLISLIKIAASAVIGKTLQEGVEGKIII